MKRVVLDAWVRALLVRPGVTLSVVLVLVVAAAIAASTLTLDTNQLNLLDPGLRQVQDTRRITDMNGGAGFLILALRGKDLDKLKSVADEVAIALRQDEERILSASQMLDSRFLRKNAALFMKTDDLEEVRRRVMAKLRDVVKRASPFFFEIKKTDPVELQLDDILAKYQALGKKRLEEDHYVSADGQMALVMIKPKWDSNELVKTELLVERMRESLDAYGKDGLRLVEDYDEKPAPDANTIEYGFTGTYKTNYDDSYEITGSLAPVSIVAFLGVVLVLIVFFRRQLFLIALVITALLLGLLMTFGFAAVTVGELNLITGILGGILMGFGIDFGIHFSFRLKWELKIGNALPQAVENTVRHAGPASFAAASGTGAAFLSLCFSQFRGFSEFGLLAGVGTFLVGAMMYLFVPAALVWMHTRWPQIRRWIGTEAGDTEVPDGHVMKRPGLVLAAASAVALLIAAFAPRIGFEYNSRALMVEGQASVRLQDEIQSRFAISSDPVAIYSKDLDGAKEVYDVFTPLDRERFSTVDAIVSIWSFVPPKEQQLENVKVLEAWREELATVVSDESKIPEEFRARYDEMKMMLSAEPFSVDDVPPHLKQIVTNLPSAKPENHGYLTLVYAGVDLWDGRMMLKFADEVEEITGSSGKEYHAAGLPILFAKLARIVLHDGRSTVGITAALLVLILLLEFRSVRDLVVAMLPLTLGMAVMLGLIVLFGGQLNFMNVIVFPIILGYGVSHGVYLIHRFNEGVSPAEALRSVGAAVACSTLTSLAGWGALLTAAHQGLASMGTVACFGMVATLCVSFTIMLPVLELLYRKNESAVQTVERMNDAEA